MSEGEAKKKPEQKPESKPEEMRAEFAAEKAITADTPGDDRPPTPQPKKKSA